MTDTGRRITTYEIAWGKHAPGPVPTILGPWSLCAPFVVERVWNVERVSGRCTEVRRNGEALSGWLSCQAASEQSARVGRYASALEAAEAYRDGWQREHDEATRRLNEADGLLDQVRRKGR